MSTTPVFTLHERLGVSWHDHPVAFPLSADQVLPPGTAVTVRNLTLDRCVPGQIDGEGQVWFLADLPAHAEIAFAVEPGDGRTCCGPNRTVEDDAATGEFRLASGALTLAIPRVDRCAPAGAALDAVPAPLCWLTGPQGVRRYSYRMKPIQPWKGDTLQIAFNVIDPAQKDWIVNPPGTMPESALTRPGMPTVKCFRAPRRNSKTRVAGPICGMFQSSVRTWTIAPSVSLQRAPALHPAGGGFCGSRCDSSYMHCIITTSERSAPSASAHA